MISDRIQTMIPEIQRYLAGQPVDKAWLFGSYSRGEEKQGSDVDILVHYRADVPISLFTISRIVCSLSKIVGCRVDLVDDSGLLPFARESVERDKLLIYERGS